MSLPQPAPAPPGPAGAVKLSEVTRRYGQGAAAITAIDHVTLSIEPGQAVAVMGPSGSGKSTLLHLIGAMDRPTSGHIHVDNHHVEKLARGAAADYRRRVGFVFQRFHLLAALSALDNVLAPLLPVKLDHDPEPRALALLADVGLAGRERSTPGQLSGGQQQRVAIARALINNPIIVLADEPTGNLDTTTGQDILTLLLSMRDQHGSTLLIATHDPTVARRCDRTIQLADGQLQPTDAIEAQEPG
ncbi:MAG: ABC transporter ATP-binding protein [Solirubrobacteraceae bacterium]